MITGMLDYFKKTVERKHDDIAVVHNEKKISFGELNTQAEALADYLRRNVFSHGPIGVYLPKQIQAVIADIGIMYTRHTFMNLDVKNPPERIQNIISHIKPVAIVTRGDYIETLQEFALDVMIINMDTLSENLKDRIRTIESRGIDTDPFCIINTSGSTGIPKGVILNHRSFLDFVRWADEEYSFDGNEIIGSLSPIVFDIFDFELCMLMYKGMQLVLLDGTLASFPVKLLQVLQRERVSFIFWVPSIMVNIANMELLDKFELPDLKTIWFAGEVFPTHQFCYWYDKLPNVDFTNLYGPIEITLDCTFYRVKERPQNDEPLPIGIPCQNTDILILNEKGELCDCGEEGELCVRGTSLAMGYYNDPEKTDMSFTQNPLNRAYPEIIYRTGDVVKKDKNGIIHFKGRRDSLIKHMGYRIELGEIEHIIQNEEKLVSYCCAVYDYVNKKIVLFYENIDEVSNKEFREQLKKSIPSYMIPSEYRYVNELPRNPNGKIDRLKLQKSMEV